MNEIMAALLKTPPPPAGDKKHAEGDAEAAAQAAIGSFKDRGIDRLMSNDAVEVAGRFASALDPDDLMG
jgi:hypothetical protein